MKYTLGLILFILIIALTSNNVILACSGRGDGLHLDELLELENILFVRGRSGQTYESIIVEEYLVGTPSMPVLSIATNGKGIHAAAVMGYYNGWCKRGLSGIPRGSDSYIAAVTRQFDGTYLVQGIFQFNDANNLPLLSRLVDDGTRQVNYQLSESEFLNTIGADPRIPDKIDPYNITTIPLSFPILIRDEFGNTYMLPIDAYSSPNPVHIGSNIHAVESVDTYLGLITDTEIILHERRSGIRWRWPIPEGVDCREINCIQFAQNGVFMVVRVSSTTVHICELALIYPNNTQFPEYTDPCRDIEHALLPGTGFAISPNSEAIAMTQEGRITVYTGLEYLNRNIHEGFPAVASTTIDLKHGISEQPSFSTHMVWSKDNRWLAYSDAQGLWLWDVYTQAPKLYLPVENDVVPVPRHFSNSGRYLAISHGNHHIIHDLYSDLVFPDGVISPDEDILLREDTVNDDLVPAEQCNLFDGSCTKLCPFIEQPLQTLVVTWTSSITTGRWMAESITCIDGMCQYKNCSTYDMEPEPIRDKIYRGLETVAIVDDAVLRMSFPHITIDLQNHIEGKIQSVEWLP